MLTTQYSSVLWEYLTEPALTHTSLEHTCVCNASGANDIDGDAITFSYEWFVNGISSGNTATYNGAVGGDTVYCVITPFDGSEYGTSVTSSTITIQNTAPNVNFQA